MFDVTDLVLDIRVSEVTLMVKPDRRRGERRTITDDVQTRKLVGLERRVWNRRRSGSEIEVLATPVYLKLTTGERSAWVTTKAVGFTPDGRRVLLDFNNADQVTGIEIV